MFFGESKYRINKEGRVPVPPRFRRELKERVVPTPGIEKYITVYPLAERKKLAVCNFLVSRHLDGFRLEGSQLDNKGGNSRSGRS
jgi:hypothetical protein